MNTVNRHKYRDFFLVFILVFVSGVPIMGSWFGQYIYLYAMLAILPFVKWQFVIANPKKVLLWIGLTTIVFVAHYLTLPTIGILADLNFLMRIVLAFLVVTTIGAHFTRVYVKVIYWLCIVSLVFFIIMQLLGYNFGVTVNNFWRSILVFNYAPDSYRNAGPFWEPGAFQGYINLAILFLMSDIDFYLKRFKKIIIVFIVTIISTQSTTGFIVTGVLMIYLLYRLRTGFLQRLFWTLIIIGALVGASQLDFMGDKIQEQYEAFTETSYSDLKIDHGRLTSIVLNMHYIEKHPWFGNGLLLETRYADDIDSMEVVGFGNGFFDFLANMGIFYVFYFLLVIFKAVPGKKLYNWLFVIIVVLLLQGECFMNYPLFWGLIFLKKDMFISFTRSIVTNEINSQSVIDYSKNNL